MTRQLTHHAHSPNGLSRPGRQSQSEPIIALIDVVFFLLVFFMLVARLDASAPFEVLPPNAGSGRDMPGGGVTISIARDGHLAVNGTARAPDEWLAAARQAAQQEQAALLRVNAHRETPLRFVLPVTEALEDAALGDVVLVVTP